MPQQSPRHTFRHHDRLHGSRAFQSVFAAKLRRQVGPIAVQAKPNGLNHHRLGLSVGRRVGNAVTRHRIKRLVREAFRLHRDDWPGAYDLIVLVRPHEPRGVEDYARMMAQGLAKLHGRAQREQTKGN